MNLFDESPQNLLPYDGDAIYLGLIMDAGAAGVFMKRLMAEVAWQHDAIQMFGKQVITARQVAWYGDSGLLYTYSKTTKMPRPWTPLLLELKHTVEDHCNITFNSCLLNLYHEGSQGMGWHADDEKELGDNPAIAALSFGAPRRFLFRHNDTKEKKEIILENGSLLLMKGTTQHHWQHSLPKALKVKAPRISLTFRTIRKQ